MMLVPGTRFCKRPSAGGHVQVCLTLGTAFETAFDFPAARTKENNYF